MFSFFKKKKQDENSLDPAVDPLVDADNLDNVSEPVAPTSSESDVDNDIIVPDYSSDESSSEIKEVFSSEDLSSVQEEAKPVEVLPVETISETVEPIKSIEVAEENNESSSQNLSWAARLKQGLSKSRNKLGKSLAGLFGGGQIDEELYEDLETILLTSDMGIDATEHLLKIVRERVSLKGLKDGSELKTALQDALYELILPLEKPLEVNTEHQPFVIMMAGVNGAGKTTSIGKLAKHFQDQGLSVLLAAGDTFRAAAREQLMEWGVRNNVTVISQDQGDSAAVCFDAIEAAKARKIDVVLADTAGRLPTQMHLMDEIRKVKRVIQKALPSAPHEVILVLDANVGQNALNQVAAFDEALGLTGLILSKLDGTAKGGVIAALAKTHPIPVRFIGVGESIDDLRTFNAKDYVDALLND